MKTKLLLLVRYQVKPGMRDEFFNKIKEGGIVEASRREDGNERYDYYIPVDDENALSLLEIWRDQAAQTAHGTQEHYQRLTALKNQYVEETQVTKYIIEV